MQDAKGRQEERKGGLSDLEYADFLAEAGGAKSGANSINQKQNAAEREEFRRCEVFVLRGDAIGAGVNIEQNPNRKIGGNGEKRPEREPAVAACRQFAGQRHEEKGGGERHQIVGRDQQREGGEDGGEIGDADDGCEVAFPGQSVGGEHERAEDGGGGGGGQDLESEGQFPEHGSEDQGRGSGIDSGGKAWHGRDSRCPYQPHPGIGKRQKNDGQFWKRARFGNGAEQVGAGDSEHGFAEDREDSAVLHKREFFGGWPGCGQTGGFGGNRGGRLGRMFQGRDPLFEALNARGEPC